MFEKFTNLAKRSITLSQDEAVTLGHDYIGTEHILLGLVRVRQGLAGEILSEQGVTADQVRAETLRLLEAAGVSANGGREATEALAAIGIDVEEIRPRADDTLGPGRFRFPRPAFTMRAKRVLELTLRESMELGHDEIGTEHLLLGLLAEGEGVGVAALGAVGVDSVALRTTVLERVRA
ncbi:MAG TPA: Clp protease N-terminal domain-containing protein [Streptosporangiaceae bacterium]|nr:Clp protease N-terminal domain-containing protein [Streptosporangiaceae bacterium]